MQCLDCFKRHNDDDRWDNLCPTCSGFAFVEHVSQVPMLTQKQAYGILDWVADKKNRVDIERAHGIADAVLIGYLRHHDCHELCEKWAKIPKWYS